MSLLGPVRWHDILDRPWWTWADVTGVSPLRVLLEGDDEQTQVPAGNAPAGLLVGDRVWCQVTGRSTTVLMRSGGAPLPSPVSWTDPSTVSVTATAWADVSGGGTVSIDLPAPALVLVTFSGWLDVPTTAKDLRVRAAWSGASSGDTHGSHSWRGVIYAGPGGYRSHSLSLPVDLAAGVTTFRTQGYAAGTNTEYPDLKYSGGTITPIRYA